MPALHHRAAHLRCYLAGKNVAADLCPALLPAFARRDTAAADNLFWFARQDMPSTILAFSFRFLVRKPLLYV